MAQCTTKGYFQGGKMQQVAKKKKRHTWTFFHYVSKITFRIDNTYSKLIDQSPWCACFVKLKMLTLFESVKVVAFLKFMHLYKGRFEVDDIYINWIKKC